MRTLEQRPSSLSSDRLSSGVLRRGLIAGPALLLLLGLGVWAADTTPTYNRDVQPILQKNCVACHAPGKVAPMSFVTYESTRPWVRQIRDMVSQKKMPPGVVERHYGLFGDDGSISQNEIDTIVRWVDAGAPEGAAHPAR